MVNNRILKGIGQTALAKVLLLSVQVGTTTVLARTLTPHDYGLVGFASVIITFLARFNSFGMVSALVRIPDATDATRITAATLNLVLSVLIFLIVFCGAPLVGHFSNAAEIPRIIRVLSLSFLLSPLAFMPTALLTREMEFGRLRTPDVVGAFVRGFVAISLALGGFKYWSLVGGSLCGSAMSSVMLFIQRPSRLRPSIDWVEAKKILAFGIPATLTGLVGLILMNSDNLIIGSTLGTVQLGYYAIAFTWGTFGTTLLYDTIHGVLFPHFAGIQRDRQQMKGHFLLSIKIVGFLAVLGNLTLLVGARQFLVGVLGGGSDRWLNALGPMQILLIYGTVRSLIETLANPLIALGHARLILLASGVAAVAQILLLSCVARSAGISGVAWLVFGCYALQIFFYLPFIRKDLDVKDGELALAIWPLFGTAVLTYLVGSYIAPYFPLSVLGFLGLALVTGTVGALVHETITRGGGTRLVREMLQRKATASA